MRRYIIALVFLLFAAAAHAQVVVPPSGNRSIQWDHDGVDVEKFVVLSDNVVVVDNIPTTPCTSCTPVTPGLKVFSVAFPALTPGNHTLHVQACNVAGCGVSDPLGIRIVVIPSKPLNFRVAVTPGV